MKNLGMFRYHILEQDIRDVYALLLAVCSEPEYKSSVNDVVAVCAIVSILEELDTSPLLLTLEKSCRALNTDGDEVINAPNENDHENDATAKQHELRTHVVDDLKRFSCSVLFDSKHLELEIHTRIKEYFRRSNGKDCNSYALRIWQLQSILRDADRSCTAGSIDNMSVARSLQTKWRTKNSTIVFKSASFLSDQVRTIKTVLDTSVDVRHEPFLSAGVSATELFRKAEAMLMDRNRINMQLYRVVPLSL